MNNVSIYSNGENEGGAGSETISSVLDMLKLKLIRRLNVTLETPLNKDSYFKSTNSIPNVLTRIRKRKISRIRKISNR